MAILLLALFIGLPLIEIAVFIQVGERIGVLPTILITVATAVAGSILLRAQGLATLTRARAQMDQGVMPAEELFNGFCILLAAFLLLVPGFVTDLLGLLLFVPAVRQALRKFLAKRLETRTNQRVFIDGEEVDLSKGWDRRPHGQGGRAPGGGPGGNRPGRKPGRGPGRGPGGVIDGEFEDITDQKADGTPANDSGTKGPAENGPPPRLPR